MVRFRTNKILLVVQRIKHDIIIYIEKQELYHEMKLKFFFPDCTE
jgi:hypothetical protein